MDVNNLWLLCANLDDNTVLEPFITLGGVGLATEYPVERLTMAQKCRSKSIENALCTQVLNSYCLQVTRYNLDIIKVKESPSLPARWIRLRED